MGTRYGLVDVFPLLGVALLVLVFDGDALVAAHLDQEPGEAHAIVPPCWTRRRVRGGMQGHQEADERR